MRLTVINAKVPVNGGNNKNLIQFFRQVEVESINSQFRIFISFYIVLQMMYHFTLKY